MELCGAFNAIAGGGVHAEAHLVTSVRDLVRNRTLYRHKPRRSQAAGGRAAKGVQRCLREAVLTGTCRQVTGAWGRDSGAMAKTGTSDGYRDAWFAGKRLSPARFHVLRV